ncbi:GntR family transcriptional regulator [Sporosarcina sp. Sa2YVA2]|uniref:GntR family transcriptional regulator n=1 Tax=Sporosarcina quadrami TaxID=2762234 RepID=A0ABR8UAC1_9BACL|nr:GntR family transcriptional regulator [Sporosarcina quadrami]MBD7984972.1 GntR family transcriptional regulator [Sporosarcina quadrami]
MTNYLSLTDHVYNYIVDNINNRTLTPNKKINESAICDALNVSRTPVREALIQLSSEGLLENIPRKGFVIKSLTTEEAKETYFLIGALDGLAASMAAPLLAEKHLKEMDFYIESIDLAINTGNFSMYHKMQEAFHNVYLSICPNRSLVTLLLQLEKKFLKNFEWSEDHAWIANKLTETNNEHRKMMELFRNGKSSELEVYMRDIHWNPEKAVSLPL